MQEAYLCRRSHEDRQTLGHFLLFDGVDLLFGCKSLELPDKDNQSDISCIPKGRYLCKKRFSNKYGWHYLVCEVDGKQVTGRKWILIHFGNYYHNTLGCILLGQDVTDINGDGYRDTTRSKFTMQLLNAVSDQLFYLNIV